MRTLIIGDSMVKYLKDYLTESDDYALNSFPGAKIGDLKRKLLGMGKYDWILIHVGTNNLLTSSVLEIGKEFSGLFQVLKSHHPSAKVVMSSIVPRSINFFLAPSTYPEQESEATRLNQKISLVNTELEASCLSQGIYFLKSLGSWEGLWGRDGLHLNRRGNQHLASIFTCTLKDLSEGDSSFKNRFFVSKG